MNNVRRLRNLLSLKVIFQFSVSDSFVCPWSITFHIFMLITLRLHEIEIKVILASHIWWFFIYGCDSRRVWNIHKTAKTFRLTSEFIMQSKVNSNVIMLFNNLMSSWSELRWNIWFADCFVPSNSCNDGVGSSLSRLFHTDR